MLQIILYKNIFHVNVSLTELHNQNNNWKGGLVCTCMHFAQNLFYYGYSFMYKSVTYIVPASIHAISCISHSEIQPSRTT